MAMKPHEAVELIHEAAKKLAPIANRLVDHPGDIVTELQAEQFSSAIDDMNAALAELEEAERPKGPSDRFLVCVDFDGVLNSYTSGWTGNALDMPDQPVDGAIQWLINLSKDERLEVCVYSSRSRYSGGPDALRTWLYSHGFPLNAFERVWFPTRKPPASIIIDDRAFVFEGTFPSADTLLAFKPWNRR